MSNLLPESAEKKVWTGYRMRFMLAGSILMIGAAIFACFAIAPSFALLVATTPPADTSSPVIQQDTADTAAIAGAQSLVTVFRPVVSATSTLSDTINSAIAQRPSGVRIDHITYTPGSTGSLQITGIAGNRELLNAYREALSGDKRFTSVSLPVGDLLGKDGGRFTVTLMGKF